MEEWRRVFPGRWKITVRYAAGAVDIPRPWKPEANSFGPFLPWKYRRISDSNWTIGSSMWRMENPWQEDPWGPARHRSRSWLLPSSSHCPPGPRPYTPQIRPWPSHPWWLIPLSPLFPGLESTLPSPGTSLSFQPQSFRMVFGAIPMIFSASTHQSWIGDEIRPFFASGLNNSSWNQR